MQKKKDKKQAVQKKKQASLLKEYRNPCILIFLLSFLLFSNTLGHDYAFDDSVAVTGNEFTKKGTAGIKDLMTKDLFAGVYGQGLEIGGGRWRPLSLITFAIEWEINGGPNAGMSHFINVLLFSLSMVLMFLVLVRITDKPLLAFLAVLLFAVHPVHSEVVANIKSRDEIFSLLFLLGAAWYLFSPSEKKGSGQILKSAGCYALALLSKENGIMFVILFPFMLMVFRKEAFKAALKKCLPLFAVAGLYLGIRSLLVGSVGDKSVADVMENHVFGMTFGERTATVAYIFLQYLRLMFFPHPLSSDYSYNQTPILGWSDPLALASLIIHLALAFLSFRVLKKYFSSPDKSPGLPVIASFGFIYYAVHLSLISNLLFNIGAPLGERFTYLASMGFCLAFAAMVLHLFRESTLNAVSLRSKSAMLIAVLCLPLAYRTFSRNTDWKDNETLFTADVKNAPNSAKVHFYLGNSLYNKAQNDKTSPERNEMLLRSKASLAQAIRINPKFHHAWNKLGSVYEQLDMADSAIYCFEKTIANNPPNLNLSGSQKGTTISFDRTSVEAMASLGSVWGSKKGNFEKAVHYLKQSLTFNPNNKSALQNLGIAYAMKGEPQNALETFQKALVLDPNDGSTYVNMGKLYGNMGDMKKAEEYFAKARSLGVNP